MYITSIVLYVVLRANYPEDDIIYVCVCAYYTAPAGETPNDTKTHRPDDTLRPY